MSKDSKNIVILGFGELSAGGWTNPQWMSQTLHSEGYEVLYFSPPAYRALKISDLKRLFFRLKPILKRLFFKVKINKSPVDFASDSVYYPFKFLNNFFNRRLHSVLQDADTTIIFQPLWLKTVDINDTKLKNVVYFKTDDYVSIAANPKQMSVLESQLIKRANYVCVTAASLLETCDNYHFLPNCIPKALVLQRDDELCFMGHDNGLLNACFIGAIWDDKVDVDMLMDFISTSKGIKFHIAGKIYSKKFKNFIKSCDSTRLTFYGVLPFESAQKLAKQCDIGLMPFLVNKYTDGMFSMKFFEYLAGGTPILVTNLKMLADLHQFSDWYLVCSHFNEDFSVLVSKLPINRTKVKDLLSNYTYENRINLMVKNNILPEAK